MNFNFSIIARVIATVMLLFMSGSAAHAQSCASTSPYPWLWPSHQNWFFGTSKKVTFPAGTVSTLPGTSLSSYEGTFAVSSDAGSLLFYGNGYKVANAAGTTTATGLVLGLGGTTSNSACQGILVTRHPLNPNVYYVFTTDDAVDGANAHGLNMYTFDALGTMLSGPTRLKTNGGANFGTTEGIAATKHSNGVDIWIAVHQAGSRTIHSFLLKCTGLSNGVNAEVSNANAGAHVVADDRIRGGMSFNYNGTRFAEAYPFYWDSDANKHTAAGISVLQFNNATGVFSNVLYVCENNDGAYDVEFSPDGNRIYVANSSSGVKTYSISTWNAATITASKSTIATGSGYGALQMGGDGNLYYNVSTLKKISGNLDAATGLTVSTVSASGTLGLPNMYLPPQEEPDIQEVGPFCTTDAAVDLSTTWLCSGLNAEDATNYPTAYAGTGITNTGTGIFNPATAGAGTHRIIFTRCSVDDTIWITVNTCCPDTSLSNIPAQCSSGGSINLNSYKVTTEAGTWSIQSAPGGSTASISGNTFNINNTTGGSYVVRFTLSSPQVGCPTYAERTITIYTKPNISLSNQSICSGDAAPTFDAGAGYTTYAWSGAKTGSSQTISGTIAGTYQVIVTNSNGCKDTASATLTINNKPNVTLTNATICSGDAAATFDAGAGYTSYTWTGNGTGTSQTTTGTAAGTYTVRVVDANGCKDTASATLTVNTKPNVTLTNATICSGDAAVTFDAGAGYTSYTWTGNGTGTAQTTTGTTAGTYTVRVVDANGCKDTASATLTVNTKPNVTLSNATICSGDAAATFDAGAGYTSYTWTGNGTGTSQTTTGTTAGTYTVRVVDANGCKDTASATLTVNAKPNVTLTNATICSGDAAATFDAGAGYTSYTWTGNGTGTSQTTSGTTAGTYTVRVVDANGCKDTASATLTVNTKPNVTLSNATICSGDAAATFDAGAGYTSYTWTANGTGTSQTTTGTTAGTYTVRVVDANGCKDTASATLTVNIKPNVTLTNATICAGDPAVSFDAGAGYTSYVWSGNGTGTSQTTSGTTAGTYTVIVTDANGCKDTASATLTVNATPSITPPSATICSGETATFDAGAGYSSYAWSGPATGSSQTIVVSIAGTYQVIVTAGSGCKDTATAVLTVNAKPNVTLTNTTICSGDAAATFDAGAGYTSYTWTGNGTGTSQTTTGTTAGTYTVRVVDANGCKDTASATLTVNTKPNVTLTNATICSGDAAVTFDAGAVYTSYTWTGNGTGTSQTTSGTTAGTYTVRVVDANGCKDTASATLTVNTKPNVTLTNATICSGDAAVTFDAGAGYTSYTWTGNGTGTAQTTTGTAAGTYTVRVVDANGCKDTASATLTVNTKPNVTLSNQTICSGDPAVTFDAGAGYTSYVWSGNGTGTSQTTSGTTAGTYTIIVTDVNGCKDTASATLTVNTNPTITPASATICSGDAAVVFDAGAGYSAYEWSGPVSGTSQTISATTAGTYTVIVTAGTGCKDTASATLTVNTKPNVTLTNATICSGDAAATFDAGAGYTSYTWTGNGTGTSQTTTGTAAGTYTVYVEDVNGCKDTASATLTVNTKPNVTLSNATICSGDAAATFDAGAGYTSYAWSANGTGTSQTTSGTTAGTYTIIVTDANGCKDTASATLTVNTKPNVTLTNATICSGDAAATFDAGAGYTSYTWTGNGTGTSQTTTGTTAGTYTVRVVDANGCKDTASATLTVNAKPNVTLSNATICSGDAAATFDAGAGYTSYTWTGNGTGTAQTTIGTTAGTYTVRVVDANGCKDTASATLTVSPKPSIAVSGDTTICPGETTMITASLTGTAPYVLKATIGVVTLTFNTSINSAIIPFSVPGVYTLEVTDANGCKITRSLTIIQNTKPNISIANATICSGDAAASFDAGAGYASYVWSANGTGTSQTTTGATAGTYTAIVTDANGCKDTASATLTVNAKPNVTLNNATICSGDAAASFDAGAGYTSYTWTGNGTGTSQTTTGTTAGTYTVRVVDANGCKDTASATLTVNTKPNVTLSNATICSGDAAATFDAGAGYTSYTWTGNGTGTSQTTTGTAAGTYTVYIEDVNGCKDTASATLTVNTKPNVTLSNATICSGDAAATFDAGAGYTSYTWTGNGTGTAQTTTGTTTGTYTVIVTDANGCKDTASATLTVNAKPSVTLTNATICSGDAAATFDAGAGYTSYTWTGNGTGTSQTTTGTTAGTYTVYVEDANGCKDTASATLTVNAKPNVTLNNATICSGDAAVVFDAGAGYSSYTWTGNGTGTAQTTTGTTAGTYTVYVEDANGCKDTASATLTVNAKPNVTLNNATICSGDAAVVFDAGAGYTSYTWTGNGTGTSQTTTGTTAGTYTVYVEDANGCKDTTSATLTVNSLPVVNLGQDAEVCYGSPATVFDAGNVGSTYLWSNSATTKTISTTIAGIYSVEVTNSNGCKSRDTVELKINALPFVNLGPDRSICPGSTTTFDAGAGFDLYIWHNSTMDQTLTVTSAGDVIVVVIDANSCSASDTAKVIISNQLAVSLGTDKEICTGASAVTFDAGNTGATYLWKDGSTNQTFSTAVAGTYWVTVTDANGCSGKDTVSLSVNPLPIVTLSNASICAGDAGAVFSPGTYSAYQWSTGETTSSITKTAAGNYSVTVTDVKGCKDSATATLTVNTLPVVSLGADRSICPGTTTTFNAGTWSAYLWNDNSTASSLTVGVAGDVTVEITDANGCKGKDTAEVSIKSNLTISIGPDKAICAGEPAVTFDANISGLNYSWSSGETTQSITTATAGEYIVTVDDGNGCTGKDTVNLVVNNLPVVDLGADKAICLGDPMVSFDAGNGYANYVWSNSSSSSSISVNQAGSYSVEVTDNNGCKDTDTVELVVNVLPVVDLGTDRSICPNTSTTFNAGSFSSYLWNDNSTASSLTVGTAGNVIVEITDVNGCKAKDTAVVSVKSNLTVSAGADKAICIGDPAVTFTANVPDLNYTWSTGETTQSITTSTAGEYVVTVDDGNGCMGKDTVNLVINNLPVVDLGPDKAICLGDPMVSFDAGNGYANYAWSNNASVRNINVNQAGVYSVEVIDNNGCKDTDTVELVVNSLPVVDLGADRDICPGMTTTFDAGTFTSYQWNNGGTNQTKAITSAGNVIVTVTDVNGCKDSDTAAVTVTNNLVVNIGADKEICAGDPAVTFDAGIAGATYAWNSGETTQTISTATGGSYAVTVTTPDGCTGTDVVTLTVNALPTVTMANQSVCAGESATFTPGTFSAYTWSTGATTASITVNTTSNFTVEVTDSKGCKNSGGASLTVNALPVVTLNDTAVCQGNSATLNAGVFAYYSWSSGETTASITKNTAGTYTVNVTDVNGCKNSASATITINTNPTVTLSSFAPKCIYDNNFKMSGGQPAGGKYGTIFQSLAIQIDSFPVKTMGVGTHPVSYFYTDNNGCVGSATGTVVVNNKPNLSIADQTICAGETATFDAGAGYTSYSWNNGSTNRTMATSTGGIYTVLVFDSKGCRTRDTVQLNVNANPQVNIGPDLKACAGKVFTVSSNITGSSYSWSNGATTSSIDVSTSGKYVLTVTDAYGCKGSDDIMVTAVPVPTIDLGPDKKVCAGQTIVLDSKLDNAASAYWSTGSKDKAIDVSTTGSYRLMAYYDAACPVYDTMNLVVVPYPISGLGNDTVVCFNEIGSLTLEAAGSADKFSWNDDALSATSSISVNKEGTYNVTLTNADLCSISDKIYVNEICVTTLYIPNAFTPNADGVNDVFFAKGLNVEKFHLMIFDRWGEMIFESYDINKVWDGTYMENPCQIDVYVWKMDWVSTNAQEQKTKNERVGTVSLIR